MKNRIYHILYGIMVATIVVMVAWLLAHFKGECIIDECFAENTDFSKGWVLEDGTEVDMAKLKSLEGTEVYKEFSVFHVIPEDLQEGQYLCFRSKNVFFHMYIDGELVYEPYVPESTLYTKSLGTRWNYVQIPLKDAGKQIEFRIIKVYESGRSSIDNLYIGEAAKAIMDTIQEKMVAFITCILTLFVGLILIIADIPINMQTQKNHELMYLGLFAVSVATWCLAETHLLQFYLGDSRTMQVVSCCSLMMISTPLILYIDAAFGFRKRGAMMAMIGVSFASFVLAMVLHLTKIADVHETLHFSHVVLAMSAVVLFYTIIQNTFVLGKNTTKNVYRILRGIGLCGISIATIIDIVRYYRGVSNDTAMFVRIGLLIFIVCYGTASLEKTVNAVKLGVQTEFVSRLAYHDGLTGIGNRTAFEEHLVDLEKVKMELPGIGIIMFDVNDLKFVNDNFGHRMGDSMLVESANLIEDAFRDKQGECFRIGGDEFVVVLSGERVQERYQVGMDRFWENMKKFNAQENKEFRLSIAHGFAMYDKNEAKTMLMNVYQQADVQMYEEKKQIKAKQISPKEYYKDRMLKGQGTQAKG